MKPKNIFILIVCIIAAIFVGLWMFKIGIILFKVFIGLTLFSVFVAGFFFGKFIYKKKE